MIVAREHNPVLVACVPRETKSQKLFRAKSFVIRTLLLCDWSVQQSANKPQTQKEKECSSVVSSRFFGGGICVTSQRTAAEETMGGTTAFDLTRPGTRDRFGAKA